MELFIFRFITLILDIFLNHSLIACFADCVETDLFPAEPATTSAGFKNTLIGFVERNS